MSNITFFIPAYNCSETIAESIDSIMETNFEDGDELIIVNDFSTDNTADVLKTMAVKYPAIKIINHKRNKGGAGSRNTAIENAKHDLLFCLDADNVLKSQSIAPLKKYLIANNADVASFQFQHFFLKDKLTPEYIFTLSEGLFDIQNYLTGKNTPGQHGNYLFTKQSWFNAKGYAEGCTFDTWTFGLKQAISGAKMVILKDTFYYHRLAENSYWMRELETKRWAVSTSSAYALYPFYDIIDEEFLNYMLGKGRYIWFYTLKTKPMTLVKPNSKNEFYRAIQQKIGTITNPTSSFLQRAIKRIKRMPDLLK